MTEPVPPTLREVTQALTIEVRKMRRTMRVQNALLAGAVAVLVVAICAVGYVTWQNHVTNAELQKVTAANQRAIADNIRANNRLLCPAFGGLISGPKPTTPRGEWSLAYFTDLFAKYGCTPEDIPQIPPAEVP